MIPPGPWVITFGANGWPLTINPQGQPKKNLAWLNTAGEVADCVGRAQLMANAPTMRATLVDARAFALETFSHGLSVKDRAAAQMLLNAIDNVLAKTDGECNGRTRD